MKISNATVTSKQNFVEKYHRLMKNLYFIFILLFFTSNECFSHFNVQQLLSNPIYFVLSSQAHLKITLNTKTISFDFIEFRILRYVYTVQFFLERDLKIQKLISGREGVEFFFQKK